MDLLNSEIEKVAIPEASLDNVTSGATVSATINPSHTENVMRRDHESVDDFEHLDPESSPVKETVTEPILQEKVSEPVKETSGFEENVNSLLADFSAPAPAAANEQKNLLDMEFEENETVASKVMEATNLLSTSEKEPDVMLAAPSNAHEINRAATAPVFPTQLVESSDDQFEAIRKAEPFDMSDKIQFESGIDLSDLMVSNDKTDEHEPEEKIVEEKVEEKKEETFIDEHIPKAKEELEAVYRSEPKHSALTVDEPEEAHASDREDDNAFVMAEKEDEAAPEEDAEEEEIVPEVEDSLPEVVEAPKPAEEPPIREEVTTVKSKAATPPPVTDDEIAACDVLGLFGQLVYWRDPKKSGLVFGGVLVVLLSLSVFSLISVVAYISLAALSGTIVFRIYKSILQAVQKTEDGHPFKSLLEAEIALTQDKVQEVTELTVAHVNGAVAELRRLFLVEDLVDSIKFGVLLWCLTYVGAWFNGMTLIIIAFVGAFTLPKVYENNKAQIDQYLDIVRSRMADVSSKVKAAIPLGKKDKEQ